MSKLKLIALSLLLTFGLSVQAKTAGSLDQQQLISNSGFTLQRLATSEKLKVARILLERARAVMIFPQLVKGALFIGGEGGSGILLARNPDGTWSYPAFYTLGSVSFGLQIGGQTAEAVLIIMNDKALTALMDDQVKLGADLSAAAGPLGSGIEASATTSLGEDIYTYSTNKGLFVGASLEGAVIARREDWNGEFYGGTTSPDAIVLHGQASNPAADPLRQDLQQYSIKK